MPKITVHGGASYPPEPFLGTFLGASDQGFSTAVETPDVEPLELEEAPYEEWTYAELQAELKYRGLAATGDTAALIARLEENDSTS